MLSWEGPYLFNLNDDPYKKLLICVQQKVIYDDKKYFWKILTLIQMKPTTLISLMILTIAVTVREFRFQTFFNPPSMSKTVSPKVQWYRKEWFLRHSYLLQLLQFGRKLLNDTITGNTKMSEKLFFCIYDQYDYGNVLMEKCYLDM